jgi:hypothetical protein
MAVPNRARDLDVTARVGAGVPLEAARVPVRARISVPWATAQSMHCLGYPRSVIAMPTPVVRERRGSRWPGAGGPGHSQSAKHPGIAPRGG